ncbi:MAG: SRPBCC family protein [Gemmatimonadales bacterium]
MATSTTTQSAYRLQVRRIFSAPPERVFRAWTTPEELKRWHAPGPLSCVLAEVDLRVGGKFRIHMRQPDGVEHRVGGTYRIVEPPHRLVYSWKWETISSNNDLGESLVTLEFLGHGNGTELVLTHEGFVNDEARTRHEHGWAGILDKLQADIA